MNTSAPQPTRSTALNRSSLSQQAVEELRRRIAGNDLAPGQRLDEAALAGDLGISRTPLREALKVLSAEGLVEIRPRRGCYVAEIVPADLEEIFPIMALLEGEVAREAALRVSAADLKRLDQLHASLERHAADGDVDRYYEVNYVFHDALQGIAGNRWLQHVIGDLRKLLKLSRHRSLRLEGRLEESLGEHRALMQALHQRDGDGAERIMKGHLLAQLAALQRLMRGLSA
ncbi:GntR family transcriptional regulator [Sulfurisoma sediminicola]|uniref:DNA-binding GntR family transcriptional regulator n=1 Tax=Sulfurisoma sediminicola TaxID=1381557 RepID=A0A497XKE3_9PROT|nr:GntR family transcriptional regulator [Sulfurisoma sediminicola]RLJ68344.1 DNA-binding GntR family transcriptional regulator [Sulfurisoma sediminicola]